jgi:hypothetical protein
MPERSCSAARDAPRRLEYAAFVVATSVALSLVVVATVTVIDWSTGSGGSALVLPAACLLAACGTWQGALLAKHLRQGCLQRVRATYFCMHLWQSLLSGAAVLYLVALCVGPIPGLGWAWLAAVALWQSVLLLPLMASPQVAENWRRWTESHRIGRLNWLVAASVALLAMGEGALCLHGLLGHAGTGAESLELARVDGNADSFDGGANWSTAFDANRGRFCVALLSDAHSTATTLTALCQRIQQALPGAEVVRLEVSLADSNTAQLSAGLDEIRPDVVLAVLPACSDWAPVRANRGIFDRERFELSRVVLGSSAADDSSVVEQNGDFESFLNRT